MLSAKLAAKTSQNGALEDQARFFFPAMAAPSPPPASSLQCLR